MSVLVACLVVLALATAGCGSSSSGPSAEGSSAASAGGGKKTSAKVGIVEIAQAEIFDAIVTGFKRGFEKTSGVPAGKTTFDIKNAQGDSSMIQSITRDMTRGGYDVYGLLGTPVVQAFAHADTKTPTIAMLMTDPVGAGVAKSFDRPGGNVTGSSDAVDPKDVAAFLAAVEPAPKKVGTIFDPSNQSSASFVKRLKAELGNVGIELIEAPVSGPGDIASAARSVADRADAIALGSDALAAGAGLPAVAQTAKAKKKPLFVAAGADPSTPGVAAVLAPDNESLGEIAGELAGKVFAGADPATQPFVTLKAQISPNPKTVDALGLRLPSSIPGGNG
jgi:putative tryptophan/tyrosine transport system substrate-binding protein